MILLIILSLITITILRLVFIKSNTQQNSPPQNKIEEIFDHNESLRNKYVFELNEKHGNDSEDFVINAERNESVTILEVHFIEKMNFYRLMSVRFFQI